MFATLHLTELITWREMNKIWHYWMMEIHQQYYGTYWPVRSIETAWALSHIMCILRYILTSTFYCDSVGSVPHNVHFLEWSIFFCSEIEIIQWMFNHSMRWPDDVTSYGKRVGLYKDTCLFTNSTSDKFEGERFRINELNWGSLRKDYTVARTANSR